MMDREKLNRAWIWLASAVGVNTRLADEIVFINDGILALYESALKGSRIRLPDGTSPKVVKALSKPDPERTVDEILSKLEGGCFRAVTRESSEYPYLLREIPDPPIMLYVKGNLTGSEKLPVAVIGARKCSDYGRRIARRFGEALASNGACVVSGMASGCDSEAAWGALSAAGTEYPTVAVLGSGIDVIYPANNERLYSAVAERGAVISEYPPGFQPRKETFPQRNRIISGMSKGVLVIEAAKRSGTGITVGFAHEQGREVFAVPGRIDDAMCAGSNDLIKNGEAKPVFDVEDVLTEFGTFSLRTDTVAFFTDRLKLSPLQRKLYDELALGEKTADALCEKLGMDASDVNIYLTEMELSGIIKRLPGGEYSI